MHADRYWGPTFCLNYLHVLSSLIIKQHIYASPQNHMICGILPVTPEQSGNFESGQRRIEGKIVSFQILKARVFLTKNQGMGSFLKKNIVLSPMETIKNNRILILKASHTLIFFQKNSRFQDLKANNFAFNSALATFKISTSVRSYLCYQALQ